MRAIRTLGRVTRALLCAVALLGLTAGTPFALLAIGHALGKYIPARSEVSLDLLLRPDDGGGVAYAVLLAAGWICWTMLVASVALEVPAALRGRRRRRVRGLGWSQHLVAVLLSGIALTASVGAAGAVDASATPGVSAPVRVGDAPQAPQVPSSAHGQAVHTGPTHTVAPGETLWSIAEERLGDGTRWTEIAELNAGHRMSDGTQFDANRAVHAGWRLRLPTDAAVPVPRAHAAPAGTTTAVTSVALDAPGTRTVTVVAGDTLSEIAERELGDADRYPDIVRASRQLVQPDGLRLTDPDEIRPGWILALPSDAPVEDEPAAAPAPPPEQPRTENTDAPAQPPTDALAPTPSPPVDELPAPVTPPAPAPPTAAAPAPPSSGHGDTDGPSVLLPASLGLGALTGAGVLATLAVRRRHQQRGRRAGDRIALPKLPAAAYEHRLRSSERPEAMAVADVALRTLASELSSAGRPMPTFTTALVTGTGIELHLDQPAPAVAPFTSSADGRRWTFARTATVLPEAEARALPAPCPALAPIADSPLGEVLLDLESCGVITVGTDRLEILRALAVALLSTTWGEDQSMHLVGIDNLQGFEEPGNPRLKQTTLPEALRDLATWQRDCAPALARESVDSARAARTLYAAPDTWPPSIVLSAEPLDADAVAVLTRLEKETPRAAWAVVAPVADGVSVPDHWHQLPTSDAQDVTLGGVATRVTPHRMGEATHAALLEIISTSDAPDDAVPNDDPAEPADSTQEPASVSRPPQAHESSLPPSAASDEDRAATFDARPPEDTPSTEAPDTDAAHAPTENDRPPGPVRPGPDGTDTDTDTDEASTGTTGSVEPSEPDRPGPEVLVLGRVEITGVGSPAERSKRARLTELAALLVLTPGLGHADVDAAMWPDSTTPANRHTAISKLRRWLGTDVDGEPYLPLIGDAGYRVGPGVTCDWHRFQRLARRGLRLGPDGITELTEALTLVRGKPFGGTSPRRYVWAEYLRQEMISAIVDVAARLGELHLAAGDVRSAKVALGKGLEVCPESEMLYRLMFRAAYVSGGPDELDAYVVRLTTLLDELGCDMEEDTSLVLRTLLGAK